jgi:serine/threonine protein kinase
MTAFWKEAIRLFHGIKAFLKHDMIHHDLKPQNIVYNPKTKRCNFIDFGMMDKYSTLISAANNSTNKFAHYWWNFPIESDFVNKSKFEENFQFNAEKNRDQLSTFYTYACFTDPSRRAKYMLNWNRFIYNHLKSYSYTKFAEKHFRTMDSFGLGLSLIYVLEKTKKYIDGRQYLELYELFENMINSNLHERIEIDDAIKQYNKILSDHKKNQTVPPITDFDSTLKESTIKLISSAKVEKIAELDPKPILPEQSKTRTITNTKTARYVKRNPNKLATRSKRQKFPKSCPEGKMRNPKTNRCIKNVVATLKCPPGCIPKP